MGFGSAAAMSPQNSAYMSQAGNIMAVGGVATSTVGSFFSALGQKNALNFQAQMDDANALHAASAGTDQASQTLQRGAQVMGAQRTGFAANGVEVNDGSAAQTIASTDTMRQVDANTTLNNAMQQAFSYQADATFKRAAASSISPGAQAFSTLLTGATNVASQWGDAAGGKRPFGGVKLAGGGGGYYG